MKEKPIGVSLVICEQVMTECVNSKRTLIGVFNSLTAGAFPCTVGAFCVFAQLTNGRGSIKTTIRCVCTETGESLQSQDHAAVFSNPNAVVELVFVFRQPSFPVSGLYAIELYCEDELVSETRFLLNCAGVMKSE